MVSRKQISQAPHMPKRAWQRERQVSGVYAAHIYQPSSPAAAELLYTHYKMGNLQKETPF